VTFFKHSAVSFTVLYLFVALLQFQVLWVSKHGTVYMVIHLQLHTRLGTLTQNKFIVVHNASTITE